MSRRDGRDSRWEEHRISRRQQVIDAAITVIEAAPAGAEIHVQQIAEAAGMVRTVVYRHFDGRTDLQRAVRSEIVSTMREIILDAISLDGSIRDVIGRGVGGLVTWVDQHPNLYLTAEAEIGDGGESELYAAMETIGARLSDLLITGGKALGHQFSRNDRAAVEAIVFGIIGQVRGTLSHWVRRPRRQPKAAVLTQVLSRSIWFQIDAQARLLGLELDPDLPLTEIFGLN